MRIQGGEAQGKCNRVDAAQRAARQAGSRFQGCSREELGEGRASDWAWAHRGVPGVGEIARGMMIALIFRVSEFSKRGGHVEKAGGVRGSGEAGKGRDMDTRVLQSK